MQRALVGAWVSAAFVLLIIPGQMLSTTASALLLSTLIFVASSTAALNGELMHTMVRPEAIARGTGVYAGIGMLSSAIGPWLFGMLISTLSGNYWGGFAFLAVLNTTGADLPLTVPLPPKCAGLRKPALSNRLRLPSPRLDKKVRHDQRLRLAQVTSHHFCVKLRNRRSVILIVTIIVTVGLIQKSRSSLSGS
jgi:hypothetical protein